MPKCVFCATEVEIIDRVGRLDECPKCGKDIHSCMQCKFYDRSAHNHCRENQSEYVPDKEKANFCVFYEFGRDVKDEVAAVNDSKKKLEELFKKK